MQKRAEAILEESVPVVAHEPTTKAPREKAEHHSGGKKKEEADRLFEQPSLLKIQIQLTQAGLSALRSTRWENGQERPVAKATVIEDGLVYTNVAVHLKGSVGSFRSIDAKPALTLNFDKFATGQSFHGLHKISLNNSVQDSSYLCEKIGRELFIAAGVPAPRASHATVELNGRNLGFYVLLEGANKQFLKKYFENAKGNLYDGGFCRDIGSRLAINCGDDPNNNSGLKNLRAAVRAAGRSGKLADLERALDVDRFLSMVALEMMICHWDGYTINRNNWRVFHDLGSNRMVFIPHGLDQLFGAGRQFDPNPSMLPGNVQGEVSRAVLATGEGQRRYREVVSRVYTNVFKVDQILARIDEIVGGVAPALAEVSPQAARSFQQRASNLKQRIIRRGDVLRQELGVPADPVRFGSDGVFQLTGWKKSLTQSGEPELTQRRDESGRDLLVINAGPTASSGSWRTRVVLSPGKYQFEGRVRVAGVAMTDGDQRSGAGLRISHGAMPRKLSGTADWKPYKYSFEVQDRSADVELVCELKATAGEAWFDAGSLRLVRLQ